MTEQEQIQWCIDQHRNTNHYYDKYLPYEFHLRMVAQVAEDFQYLLQPGAMSIIIVACYGHDLIEGTRCLYNDCKERLGYAVADIIYALTNEKGRNRAERGNDKYYAGINAIPGAIFVKLCDRIANVQYSKLTKSKMFEMYEKENEKFKDYIYDPDFKQMFDYLDSLFDVK